MVVVTRVVTWLEMTDPTQLRPPATTGISLEPWRDDLHRLRALHDEIARPHPWPSLAWSQDAWAHQLAANTWRAVAVVGDVAGLVAWERQPGQVEITIFGLLPGFRGRGLGGAALTLAVREAWEVPGTQRVWLHTTTRDGSQALPNYLARGFVAYRTETKTEELD